MESADVLIEKPQVLPVLTELEVGISDQTPLVKKPATLESGVKFDYFETHIDVRSIVIRGLVMNYELARLAKLKADPKANSSLGIAGIILENGTTIISNQPHEIMEKVHGIPAVLDFFTVIDDRDNSWTLYLQEPSTNERRPVKKTEPIEASVFRRSAEFLIENWPANKRDTKIEFASRVKQNGSTSEIRLKSTVDALLKDKTVLAPKPK